jgi:hypothetical protein
VKQAYVSATITKLVFVFITENFMEAYISSIGEMEKWKAHLYNLDTSRKRNPVTGPVWPKGFQEV